MFMNKKFIIGLAVIIVAAGSAYYFLNRDSSDIKQQAQAKEWTVKRDDIQVAVETDGKVVAEDGVELSFSVSGDRLEVTKVYVSEGGQVKKGDQLAAVKTDDLEYDLNKAYLSYQKAKADYDETLAGATTDEIADAKAAIENAEISLAQIKATLEKTKINAQDAIDAAEDAVDTARENLQENQDELTSEDVEDAYEDLADTIKAISISLESMLPESDEILGVDNKTINDDFEQNIGAQDLTTISAAKSSYMQAKREKELLSIDSIGLSTNSSYSEVDAAGELVQATLEAFEDHLYDMQLLLEATVTSDDLSQSALDSLKATINSNRNSINTKISTISNGIKAVADAKEGLDDYIDAYEDALKDLADAKVDAEQDIATAESNIRAKELSLEDKQRSYEDILAPLTASELASIRSSLTTASINVDKARNDLDKATLTSPIDGEVAMLNYKAGDIILNDDTKPVAVIINKDTLFIEVNVEEADINKLVVGQKSYATFDALNELELEGEISFISLTSASNNSGIVTYLVRVIIDNSANHPIREGMTAFVNFVTAGVKDVLTVPVEAVRNVGGKPSLQLTSGEWVPVTTGFTDGDNVEIISGMSEGERILY